VKSTEVFSFEGATLIGEKAILLQAIGVAGDRISNSTFGAAGIAADFVRTETLLVKSDNGVNLAFRDSRFGQKTIGTHEIVRHGLVAGHAFESQSDAGGGDDIAVIWKGQRMQVQGASYVGNAASTDGDLQVGHGGVTGMAQKMVYAKGTTINQATIRFGESANEDAAKSIGVSAESDIQTLETAASVTATLPVKVPASGGFLPGVAVGKGVRMFGAVIVTFNFHQPVSIAVDHQFCLVE